MRLSSNAVPNSRFETASAVVVSGIAISPIETARLIISPRRRTAAMMSAASAHHPGSLADAAVTGSGRRT
ncbi:hypothetical protein [Rhizobium sp. J15]|uniref:hypothetical protein n=1 Tax=Rhizobium sp. J15 TaxID=2035450 RepID=UPI001FE1371B|nr:hypothetical protein [Rhizobium sp. J15]